jgi:hypothetical protein
MPQSGRMSLIGIFGQATKKKKTQSKKAFKSFKSHEKGGGGCDAAGILQSMEARETRREAAPSGRRVVRASESARCGCAVGWMLVLMMGGGDDGVRIDAVV